MPLKLAQINALEEHALTDDHQDNIDSANSMQTELLAELEGSKIGTAVSGGIIDLIELNNDFSDGESFALATLVNTFGENLGQVINSGVNSESGFNDFGSDLSDTSQVVGLGMVSGAITAELVSGLDWNQEWSAVASGVTHAYVSNGH